MYTATYERNAAGRITRVTEAVQDVSTVYEYGYDAAGRLSTVMQDGAALASYQYDQRGNRTSYSTAKIAYTPV